MALDISGASHGLDVSNIKRATDDLNVQCIEETKRKMEDGLTAIYEAVDANWVGESAKIFKENMDSDRQKVYQGLDETYQQLLAEFDRIKNEWINTDQTVLGKRG